MIICPTTPAPAFKFGEKMDEPLHMYLNDVYTVNANLAGIAGISLPGGLTEVDGKALPVGVQLIGPVVSEANLLRAARMFESQSDNTKARATLKL